MRWILTLVALALGAWYLSDRQRRAQLQQRMQDVAPPAVKEQAQHVAGTVTDVTAAARERTEGVQSQVVEKASQLADAAKNAGLADKASQLADAAKTAGTAAMQQAQSVAANVQQATGNAAANVQEASGPVADRAQEAADSVTGAAQQAMQTATETAQQAKDGASTAAQQARDAVSGAAQQAKDAASDAAQQAAQTATDGAPGATAPSDGGIAPEGQRPRPIAGEGTTTATGAAVDALSPIPDGPTSTGVAEPLPEGLTPGEPGTGGPRGSTMAPSTPDSTESPTTGMEQPPVVDRAAEVLERTSGNFIGNKKTRVFHAADAGNLPGEDNRVYFESEEEAVAAGFRPAEREGLETAES